MIDDEVKLFLKFWDEHGLEKLTSDTGVLSTGGCSGDGGCCAKQYNLDDLACALRELVGPTPAK